MQLQFATGLFDKPYVNEAGIATLNSAVNQALALRAAEEGVVLLKNTRGVLPLATGQALKIAVVGPNAHGTNATLDSVRKNYLGSYTQWEEGMTVEVPTVFEALQAHYTNVADGTTVRHASFSSAALIPISSYSLLALSCLHCLRHEEYFLDCASCVNSSGVTSLFVLS